MKRGWLKGVLEAVKLWFSTPFFVPYPHPRRGRARASRAYSISGWVRGADGTYQNDGHGRIYKDGRSWYRDTPTYHGGGVTLEAVPYPSLRAAIAQEKPAELPLLRGFCYCLQPTEQKDGFCVSCGKAFSPAAVETKGLDSLLAEAPRASGYETVDGQPCDGNGRLLPELP